VNEMKKPVGEVVLNDWNCAGRWPGKENEIKIPESGSQDS